MTLSKKITVDGDFLEKVLRKQENLQDQIVLINKFLDNNAQDSVARGFSLGKGKGECSVEMYFKSAVPVTEHEIRCKNFQIEITKLIDRYGVKSIKVDYDS